MTLPEMPMQELDSLQPPHVAYWAVVARRVAYPAFFGDLAPGLDQGWSSKGLGWKNMWFSQYASDVGIDLSLVK